MSIIDMAGGRMFGYFIIVGGTMLFGWATMILVTPNREQIYKVGILVPSS